MPISHWEERLIVPPPAWWDRPRGRTQPADHLREVFVMSSVRAGSQASETPSQYDAYYEEDRAAGWLVFGGVLILLLGTINIIDGIAAIGRAHFYVANARYVFGDLNTWGWVALCLGVAQLAVGFGIFVKNQFARWTGVVVF